MRRWTPEGRAKVVAAITESNHRRGEQDTEKRRAKRLFVQHKIKCDAS